MLAAPLLLLAGNVTSNPGPFRDPCELCAKGCWKNQKAVQCECNTWFHAKCLDMGLDEYTDVCHPAASWSCLKCLFPLLQDMDIEDIAYDATTHLGLS